MSIFMQRIRLSRSAIHGDAAGMGSRLGLRQRRANTSAARRDFGQNDGAEQKKGALAVFNVLAFSPSLA